MTPEDIAKVRALVGDIPISDEELEAVLFPQPILPGTVATERVSLSPRVCSNPTCIAKAPCPVHEAKHD